MSCHFQFALPSLSSSVISDMESLRKGLPRLAMAKSWLFVLFCLVFSESVRAAREFSTEVPLYFCFASILFGEICGNGAQSHEAVQFVFEVCW